MKMLTTSLLSALMALGFAGSTMAASNQDSNKTGKQSLAKAPVKTKIYRVKRGDTLEKIAAHYKVSMKEIMRLNNLHHANQIKIGMDIKLS
ncbi:LysM peptidoglycan-binding domain-containing protein [Leucothrix mucor]|jgi:LysM repeat protein|uniref:LysM peptidoglycan-binding domain-containing protein n=1 Tax=Leucothrix mucor TaxID=45248 RepID=UPI0003B6A9D7|nr:LysM domain-containing protein [Leucothrix mucor]